MDLGQHASFIWASYGALILVLLALGLWLVLDGRRYQRALKDFEERGIKRTSSSPSVSSTD